MLGRRKTTSTLPGLSSAADRRFDEDSRRIVARACEIASEFGHAFVGPSHLVMALTESPTGEVARRLEALGWSAAEVHARAEALLPPRRSPVAERTPSVTSHWKAAMEATLEEADGASSETVRPEHMFVGVLRHAKSDVGRTIRELGLVAADVRTVDPDAGVRYALAIEDDAAMPIYDQLITQVREGIATGKLRPGDQLPTIRQSADRLGIATGTVARAYAELEREGTVVTEGKLGTRIATSTVRPRPARTRRETLVGLLRPVAVSAFHLGASAAELRTALEAAMDGILDGAA